MIVDTGILYGLADAADPDHRACAAVFSLPEPKVVPEPVIVEASWLIEAALGAEAEGAFLRGCAEGSFSIECPSRVDRERAAEIVDRYRDARIGYVDAVVVAIAERLGETRVATLDRRDFTLVRPRHAEAFELLP